MTVSKRMKKTVSMINLQRIGHRGRRMIQTNKDATNNCKTVRMLRQRIY